MAKRYGNLDKAPTFAGLKARVSSLPDLKACLTQDRLSQYRIQSGCLSYYYATAQIDDDILDQFQLLSEQQEVIPRFKELLEGHPMNLGEGRAVSHHHSREVGTDNFYMAERNRIAAYVHKIHNGVIKGVRKKPFNTVVQIGIGGSDLGPRAVYHGLRRYVESKQGELPMTAHFISNVDPDDALDELAHIDFERTLFVVVSKSGSTLETMANLELIKDYIRSKRGKVEDMTSHFIAVTTKGSLLDNTDTFGEVFYIDDAIGGRFSVTSAVGALLISLCLGNHVFNQVLEGARDMDLDSENPDIRHNMALLSALISVWESSCCGYSAKAIIPYSTALSQFPKHLQQLICESNGKRVSLNGDLLTYKTSPAIFGEPGTNGQHSFFQMLHQGTSILPIQFIGFASPQMEQRSDSQAAMNHEKLLANLIAQMVALAVGQDNENPAKCFPGNRPSTLLFSEQLTPKVMGALLSFFENQTMFQGFLWNINSFDQEGVQLGKNLAKDVLSPEGSSNSLLKTWQQLLGGLK